MRNIAAVRYRLWDRYNLPARMKGRPWPWAGTDSHTLQLTLTRAVHSDTILDDKGPKLQLPTAGLNPYACLSLCNALWILVT